MADVLNFIGAPSPEQPVVFSPPGVLTEKITEPAERMSFDDVRQIMNQQYAEDYASSKLYEDPPAPAWEESDSDA